MSSTQRTASAEGRGSSSGNYSNNNKYSKHSTQNLTKILLGSSSSSSIHHNNRQNGTGGGGMHIGMIGGGGSGQGNNHQNTQEKDSSHEGMTTYRTNNNNNNNQMMNGTGKHWRNFVTPIWDTLKKRQFQKPDYSNEILGTVDGGPILGNATVSKGDTSMDTGNYSMHVQEFTPSNDIDQQLKIRTNIHQRSRGRTPDYHNGTTTRTESSCQMLEQSSNSTALMGAIGGNVTPSAEGGISLTMSKMMQKSLLGNLESAGSSIGIGGRNGGGGGNGNGGGEDPLAQTSTHMKSLIKSFNNGNYQFYDNLHKKYFDKAKESNQTGDRDTLQGLKGSESIINEESSKRRPPQQSKNNPNTVMMSQLEKSELAQTNKSNTLLGGSMSQLNYTTSQNVTKVIKDGSIIGNNNGEESLEQSKPSMLRASSLQQNKNSQITTNTMSINFKNSLYNKIRPTASQLAVSQLEGPNKGNYQQKQQNVRRHNKHSILDSSDDDSSIHQEDEEQEEEMKHNDGNSQGNNAAFNQQRQMKRQIEILSGTNKKKLELLHNDDSLQEDDQNNDDQHQRMKTKNYIMDKNAALSRGDLSTRVEDGRQMFVGGGGVGGGLLQMLPDSNNSSLAVSPDLAAQAASRRRNTFHRDGNNNNMQVLIDDSNYNGNNNSNKGREMNMVGGVMMQHLPHRGGNMHHASLLESQNSLGIINGLLSSTGEYPAPPQNEGRGTGIYPNNNNNIMNSSDIMSPPQHHEYGAQKYDSNNSNNNNHNIFSGGAGTNMGGGQSSTLDHYRNRFERQEQQQQKQGNNNNNRKMMNPDDLKPEDLIAIKEKDNYDDYQHQDNEQDLESDDILKTYQQYSKQARTKVVQEELPMLMSNAGHQQTRTGSGNNSQKGGGNTVSGSQAAPSSAIQSESKQQLQKANTFSNNRSNNDDMYVISANPYGKQQSIQQQKGMSSNNNNNNNVSSLKSSHMYEDGQRSDFTFVLSQPLECHCDNQDNANASFLTNQQQKQTPYGMNSELKSQQYSSQNKGKLKGFQNRLQEIVASPIYSEGGGLPGGFIQNQNQCCYSCGGNKLGIMGNAAAGGGGGPGISSFAQPRMSIQQRLSYANLNNQSIKEEREGEDEEYNLNHMKGQGNEDGNNNMNQGSNSQMDDSYCLNYQTYSDVQPPRKIVQHSSSNLGSNNLNNLLMNNDIISGELLIAHNHSTQQDEEIGTEQDDEREIIPGQQQHHQQQRQNNFNDEEHQENEGDEKEDDVMLLRTLVQVQYECMSKILQEGKVTSECKSDMVKLLSFIQNMDQQQKGSIAHHHQQQQQPQFDEFSSQQLSRDHQSSVEDAVQNGGDNLTLSQLQQQKRDNNAQQQQQNQKGGNMMKAQQQQQKQKQQRKHQQVQQEEENQYEDLYENQEQQQKENIIHATPSPNQQQNRKIEGKNLNNNNRKADIQKQNKMKGSLISSKGCNNSYMRETVYSYMDAEDEDQYVEEEDDEEQYYENQDKENDDSMMNSDMKMRTRHHHNNNNNMNPYNYKSAYKNHPMRSNHKRGSHYKTNPAHHHLYHQHAAQSHHKENDLKKSIRKTKKNLVQARAMLRQEKQLNQEQEDKILKMQAEIEALNMKWKMTEDKIKASENMYLLLQRTNSIVNNASIGTVYNPSQASIENGSSVVGMPNQYNKFGSQTTSMLSLNQRRYSPAPIAIANQHNTISSNHSNNSHQMSSFTNFNATANTNINNNLDTSKQLVEINDRLTKQIEDNLMLFDNLNNELYTKDQVLAEKQAVLQQKDQEVHKLQRKISEMGENMKDMMDVSKISGISAVTNSATAEQENKQKHQQEIENIKQRKNDYDQRIARIQSVFNNSQSIINRSTISANQNDISRKSNQFSNIKKNISTIQNAAGPGSGGNNTAAKRVLQCVKIQSPSSLSQNTMSNMDMQQFNQSRIHGGGPNGGFNGCDLSLQQLNDDHLPTKLEADTSIVTGTATGYGRIGTIGDENKENSYSYQNRSFPHINQTLITSQDHKVLNSLCQNLKDSSQLGTSGQAGFQQQIQQQQVPQNFEQPSQSMINEDSTMFKYSQDASFQKTLRRTTFNPTDSSHPVANNALTSN